MRTFLSSLVLFMAGALILAESQYPTPYSGTKYPASGYGNNHYPTNAAVASSVYDDATSCWSFNDPSDLGNDDCGSNDLTEVNTPTATGGALGYAMEVVSASTEYADADDSADTSIGSGVSWGFAGWIRVDTSDTRAVFGKGDAMDTEGDFDGVFTLGGVFTCRLIDSAGAKTDTHGTVTAGAREFVSCRYNATTNELEAGEAGSWSGSATSTASDGADLADKLTIGANTGGANPTNGVVGPVWWYRSASGGEVLTDAYATSLYNSGKGKTCADTTETTNLVSCWEMDEDGGPYVDSVGSNDLTAVNTPTRTAGLVSTGTASTAVSDMALHSSATADNRLGLTNTDGSTFSFGDINTTGELTVAFWANSTIATAGHLTTMYNPNSYYQWGIANGWGSAGRWKLTVYDGVAAECAALIAAEDALSLHQWYLVVARIDTTSVSLRINDGSVTASCTPDSWTPNSMTTGGGGKDFGVGGDHATSQSYTGSMDNYAIWTKKLSAADETTMYNSGAGTFYAVDWNEFLFGGDMLRYALNFFEYPSWDKKYPRLEE